MPVLTDTLNPNAEAFSTNRESMLAHLAAHDTELAKAIGGGGPAYVERHRTRGKMLARERIEAMLDPASPFLELSPLAAWGSSFPVGAGLITGIGVIEGTECLIIANDPTVRGGASNPFTMRKNLRAMEIARQNQLPLVNLVESGGADLPTQSEIFIPGGQGFHDITELSAMGVPTVAVVFGNSTAGGAYTPGMSDYIVMIKERSKVFLGGPPLVKMATGEDSDDESLGGAEMHARISGLADYFAVDDDRGLHIVAVALQSAREGVLGDLLGDGGAVAHVVELVAHDLGVRHPVVHRIHIVLGHQPQAEALGHQGFIEGKRK